MTTKVYIKERAFGRSSTITDRAVSSFKSTYFKYDDLNELSDRLAALASNSSILHMLVKQPHLTYEMNIININ